MPITVTLRPDPVTVAKELPMANLGVNIRTVEPMAYLKEMNKRHYKTIQVYETVVIIMELQLG